MRFWYLNKFFHRPKTVNDFEKYWISRWRVAQVTEPELSFMHLVAKVLSINHNQVKKFNDDYLNRSQRLLLNQLCHKRLKRMPVQHIIEEWDFRKLTLKMCSPVFIPRPETEELVSLVLKELENLKLTGVSKPHVLEIGCGTGAIILSIAKECSKAQCSAFDTNPSAYHLTRLNASLVGLQDRVKISEATLTSLGTLLGSAVTGPYDVIVSNPPYITTQELNELEEEVLCHEDFWALYGGCDGLEVVNDIIKFAAHNLVPNGKLFLEVGLAHSKVIQEHFELGIYDRRLRFEHKYQDYTKRDRFVEIKKIKCS